MDKSKWFLDEVQPHEASLRSYLRHSLPSSSDVDDTVQETYLRILEVRRTNAVDLPRQLLFAIARNLVRDFIRKKQRNGGRLIPLEETPAAGVLDETPDASELASRLDDKALLLAAIDALPARCRQVMILRKFKNLSQKEIATLLGISESTVESLVVTGTKRVADHVRRIDSKGKRG